MNQQNQASFIWSVADLLRGDFKQSEYGRIILPFTLLRRIECVLEPTRKDVLTRYNEIKKSNLDPDLILPRVSGHQFYNVSKYSLATLGEGQTLSNLEDYLGKFSSNAHEIFENSNFDAWLARLESANLLYLIIQKFTHIDLHPYTVSNHEMGLIFEELIRRFAEAANDTAGEFFTPRDVVRLATTLVFSTDQHALTGDGVVRTVYDPCAGTGGFLASGME